MMPRVLLYLQKAYWLNHPSKQNCLTIRIGLMIGIQLLNFSSPIIKEKSLQSQWDCASRRMFVATFTSFRACTSACLALFLSKPIETRVAMESSDGSIADGIEEG